MNHKIQLKNYFSNVGIIIFLATSHTLSNAQSITESEIKQLIETRAVGARLSPPHYFACDDNAMQKQMKEISLLFAQSQPDQAGAYAGHLARNIAACYIENPRSIVPSVRILHPTLPALAEKLGIALTLETLGTGNTPVATHAKTFLQFAQINGIDTSGWMRKLKGDGAEGLASDTAIDLSTTAVAAVAKRKANSFAFDQNYLKKVIRLTGKIQAISGEANSARITLVGNTTIPLSSQSFADSVSCTVEEPQALKKTATLSKGQSVTLRGIYSESFMGSINLTRCEIL